MNDTILKLLGLLLTSYWWFPLVRTVAQEAWNAAEPESQESGAGYRLSAADQRGSEGWNAKSTRARGASNSSWSCGRRAVVRRSQGFQNNSRSDASLTSFVRRRL